MPSQLPVLLYPNPILRKISKPVDEITPEIKTLVVNMLATMYAVPGIGLSAIQVSRPLRIVVMDMSELKTDPEVFINPEIESSSGSQVVEEGCLSLPGFFEEVKRASRVEITAKNIKGTVIDRTFEGLAAACIQHEMDHLDGKVFVDYLSRLKRNRIRKRMLKAKAVA